MKTTTIQSAVKKNRAVAKKARRAVREMHREPRAFIERGLTTDALAAELAEDAVRAMTSGEDEPGERDGERLAQLGGPFLVSRGEADGEVEEE